MMRAELGSNILRVFISVHALCLIAEVAEVLNRRLSHQAPHACTHMHLHSFPRIYDLAIAQTCTYALAAMSCMHAPDVRKGPRRFQSAQTTGECCAYRRRASGIGISGVAYHTVPLSEGIPYIPSALRAMLMCLGQGWMPECDSYSLGSWTSSAPVRTLCAQQHSASMHPEKLKRRLSFHTVNTFI